MTQALPSSLPGPHRTFLTTLMDVVQCDARILGVAAGGSFLTNSMDEFSDLDLILAVDPVAYENIMEERHQIAAKLGVLLAAFTGEHIGEPRLLICLYDGNPPLHVDLKFVELLDLARRIEDLAVLWERKGKLTRALEVGVAEFPLPDLQWIEDRFWVWVHYVTTKIGRGELFEAIECLSYLRVNVLGPLALLRSGHRPAGVRRFEQLAPDYIRPMQETVATHRTEECIRALHACIDLYRLLRTDARPLRCRGAAEAGAMQYLSDIERR